VQRSTGSVSSRSEVVIAPVYRADGRERRTRAAAERAT
jgi:hypothetical protein